MGKQSERNRKEVINYKRDMVASIPAGNVDLKDFRRGREEAEMKAVKKTMRDLYALAGNRMRQ